MEPLVVVLASILALNLAYGLFIGALEVRRHRKARREIGTLEAMWRLDPRPPHRNERRAVRSFRVAGALAASLLVLGGIAVATPGGLGTVSTVTEAIGSLISPPDGQVAEAPEPPTTEGASGPRADRTSRDDRGGGGNHDVATGGGSRSDIVDDPVLSPVTEPDTVTEAPDPNPEQAPGDGDPTTEPSPPPAVDPAPAIVLHVTPGSATSVTLTWNALPSATGYRLERSGGSNGEWAVEVPAGTTSVADEGLEPETAYTYRVTATLGDESQIFDEETAITPAAPVP